MQNGAQGLAHTRGTILQGTESYTGASVFVKTPCISRKRSLRFLQSRRALIREGSRIKQTKALEHIQYSTMITQKETPQRLPTHVALLSNAIRAVIPDLLEFRARIKVKAFPSYNEEGNLNRQLNFPPWLESRKHN